MHHAKSITIPRYIITLEHLPKCNDIISQVKHSHMPPYSVSGFFSSFLAKHVILKLF